MALVSVGIMPKIAVPMVLPRHPLGKDDLVANGPGIRAVVVQPRGTHGRRDGQQAAGNKPRHGGNRCELPGSTIPIGHSLVPAKLGDTPFGDSAAC